MVWFFCGLLLGFGVCQPTSLSNLPSDIFVWVWALPTNILFVLGFGFIFFSGLGFSNQHVLVSFRNQHVVVSFGV